MAKIIRLTESDLTRIVKRVIQEKRIASFDDEMGWYDEEDRPVKPEDFGDDYDEEEFHEFEPMIAKHGKNQKWFMDPSEDKFGLGGDGEKMFHTYRERTGKPFRIRTYK